MPKMLTRAADRRHPAAGYARAALYGTAVVALAAAMPTPAVADDMTELKVELQELLDRMEQVEQRQDQTQAAIDDVAGSSLIVNRAIRKRAVGINPGTSSKTCTSCLIRHRAMGSWAAISRARSSCPAPRLRWPSMVI